MTEHHQDPDTTSASATDGHDQIHHYEIRVRGHLAPRWSAWFDGLDVTDAGDGTTVISGPLIDESALHGLLHKLRDIGVPLLALTQLPTDAHTNPERP